MPTTIITAPITTAPTSISVTGSAEFAYISAGSIMTDVGLFASDSARIYVMGEILGDGTAVMDTFTTLVNDIPQLFVGAYGSMTGIYQLFQGNSLSLHNDGIMQTTSPFGSGIAVYAESSWGYFNMVNTGTISVTVADATGSPVLHSAAVASDIGGVINNSGTIYGPGLAIWMGDYIAAAGNGGHGDVFNSGVIDGGILFATGNDILGNRGSIFGDIDLGAGNDFVDSRGGVIVGSVMAGAGDDTVYGGISDDTIDGGLNSDTIRGNEGNDSLLGGGNEDNISGGAGDDYINGGASSDYLIGGLGHDNIIGDGGNDTINGSDGNDTVFGLNGSDLIMGSAGDDDLAGNDGADTLFGGAGDDTLGGGVSNDSLSGGSGNDFILGWTGDDTINGNAGDDDLRGQNGDDVINGGWGNDTMSGGANSDTFVFITRAGDDVVTDFQDGSDMIDLSAFQMASFASMSGAITDYNGGSLIDLVTLGGDGSIWVQGVASANLTAADFIL